MTIATESVHVSREQALETLRAYQKHLHYSQPVDHEIMQALRAIAAGRLVIRALASVTAAGLNEAGLPKLAICRADATECHLSMRNDGSARFCMRAWQPDHQRRQYLDFPAGAFPGARHRHAAALVPLIPLPLRPKRGLANYHVLWEAEWRPVPPVDPLLLRRIGKGDLWQVLAAWDLSEIERAVLASRVAVRGH